MSDLPTPSKELGQHFLVDENIIRVIGRLAEVTPDDVVLEIGPGQGVLTAFLMRVSFTLSSSTLASRRTYESASATPRTSACTLPTR